MDFLVKVVLTIVAMVICFLPTEYYFLIRWLVQPKGFWQELIFGIMGLPVVIVTQIVGLVVLLGAFFIIWEKDSAA